MLRPNPQVGILKVGSLGGDYILRMDPSQMGLMTLWMKFWRVPLPLGVQGFSKKLDINWASPVPDPGPQLPKVWEIDFCSWHVRLLLFATAVNPNR